jgi:hypothetical protein
LSVEEWSGQPWQSRSPSNTAPSSLIATPIRPGRSGCSAPSKASPSIRTTPGADAGRHGAERAPPNLPGSRRIHRGPCASGPDARPRCEPCSDRHLLAGSHQEHLRRKPRTTSRRRSRAPIRWSWRSPRLCAAKEACAPRPGARYSALPSRSSGYWICRPPCFTSSPDLCLSKRRRGASGVHQGARDHRASQ